MRMGRATEMGMGKKFVTCEDMGVKASFYFLHITQFSRRVVEGCKQSYVYKMETIFIYGGV